MKRACYWLAGLCLCAVAAPAVADLANVYLTDGGKLRGDVTVTETEVIIRNVAGEIRYDKDKVSRIEWIKEEAQKGAGQAKYISVDKEYLQRFQALKPDDMAGHFALAEWVRDKERWDLLEKQCNYILALEPDHRNAKLMLQLARKERAAEAAAEAEKQKAEAAERPPLLSAPPLLSESDVLRLKLYEYALDGRAEKVHVKFLRKRGGPTFDSLVLRDLGQREFGDELQEEYRRAQPHEKLQLLLNELGMKYADRIQISGDPEKFTTFRKRVLPMVYRGCGKASCHGGASAVAWRLPKRSQRTEGIYTAFLVMDGVQSQYGPLVNREEPDRSALLTYMMPSVDNEQPHPPLPHGQRLIPLVKGYEDRNYELIVNWINSLNVPHPVYELDYKYPDWLPKYEPPAEPEPTTQPAENAEAETPEKETPEAAEDTGDKPKEPKPEPKPEPEQPSEPDKPEPEPE